MSGWRDRLIWADESNSQRKKASFRGATFFIRDAGRSVGRRNIVHQYPFKDDPYVEDLGLDADEFTINGYVIQNSDNDQDYIDERDALIAALRVDGPGTLIHPFYGELQVSVFGKARIAESFREGGIAHFSMTFVRVNEVQSLKLKKTPYQKKELDHQKAVDDAAELSFSYAKDGFGAVYDPEDAPAFVENSIMEAFDSLNNMLKSVSMSVQSAFPSQVSQALSYLAETKAGIDVSKIRETCELADDIIDMFNGLASIVGLYGDLLTDQLLGRCSVLVYGYYSGPMSAAKVVSDIPGASQSTSFSDSTMESPGFLDETLGKTALRALLSMNQFGKEKGGDDLSVHGGALDPVPMTTCYRVRESANLVAVVNMARVSALITAAKTAVRIKYTSYNSAVEIMNEVMDEFEAFLLKLGNDSADTDYDACGITISDPSSYNAIESLRPVFVEAMKGVGALLPAAIAYEIPPTTISSLVLAYEKYADLDREKEIIDRNITLIKHPGFLPGGQSIEILER